MSMHLKELLLAMKCKTVHPSPSLLTSSLAVTFSSFIRVSRRAGLSWLIASRSFFLSRKGIYFLQAMIFGFETMIDPNLRSIAFSCWLRSLFFSEGHSRSIVIFYYSNQKFSHRKYIHKSLFNRSQIPTPIKCWESDRYLAILTLWYLSSQTDFF